MVIELNNNFYRIQVKTANEIGNGSIKCYARSSDNHCCKTKGLRDYQNQVDYFVFYNQDLDKIALVPMEDIGDKKSISLRIESPKNNQGNIRYFDDYSFDKILCVETLHEEPKL